MYSPATAHRIPTADGDFAVWLSAVGVSRIEFPGSQLPPAGVAGQILSPEQNRWLKAAARAIHDVLRGVAPHTMPPLDLSAGTEFQQAVWRALQTIPPGNIRSYQEIAVQLRRRGAARAVGGACGANPIPLLIPCHRVVGANHRLGGFSGGLDWKVRLLAREGSWPLR